MAPASNSLTFLDLPEDSSWFGNSAATAALEQNFIPAYLARARWFPSSSAAHIKPKIIASLPFPNDTTVLAVIETDHQTRYLMPLQADWSVDPGPELEKSIVARLRSGERGGLLRDVASDPAFIKRLLDHLRREASIAGSGWLLDFKPTTKLGSRPPRIPSRIRAVQGEQSNSTALVDHDYVVKLYRHIEPGRNPEIEMGQFLTEATNFTHTPTLLGHIEATHASANYALGVIHAFVPNEGDAWAWSADRLKIYLHAIEGGSEDRDKALIVRRDYLQWVRCLGCRVAEMHRALASRDNDAAFKPEPIDERDRDYWISDVTARAARIFDRLEELPLDMKDRHLVLRLLRRKTDLSDYAARLLHHSLGRCKIRHHGDLHLGQVLVSGGDAVIIDFEGEPSRPLADRRRKAPAARDVAGIVRSLDYAAMALGQQQGQDSEKLSASALRALYAWRDQSTNGFLAGYREAMGPSVLWPNRAEDAKAMLDFFLFEKALYEVEYELSYRPAWISLPLHGILRILQGVTYPALTQP
jgi:trehalose synthase-fused probable maltokinase